MWIVYYLEIQYNEQEFAVVAKLTKADLECFCLYLMFIKHMFKRRDVLHIGCLVEKVINYIVLIH